MKLRDFFKQFDEPKNSGVLPERGHAPSVVSVQSTEIAGISYKPLSDEPCLITAKELRERANEANNKVTLIEDFDRLGVLLERRAAKGEFDISLNRCYFKASIKNVTHALTSRGFRVQVTDSEIKLIWGVGGNR